MVFASLYSFVTFLGALLTSSTRPSLVNSGAFPDYVLNYAPHVFLYSKEGYWPSDLAVHIQHVVPKINGTTLASSVTLETVSQYNGHTYLTSKDNQANHAKIAWITSTYGKPDSSGVAASAPATIIVAEKNGGILDAFYFYFYSYNYGPAVLGEHWGNHVGDWEHSMVRFVNGQPSVVYYSQHTGGSAYQYSAVQKNGVRPVSYAATGSHANYPTAGEQDYEPEVPGGILHDSTDAGFYWDVTKNYRGYWYDVSSQVFTSSGGGGQGGLLQASEGVGWLKFAGMWGDAQIKDLVDGQVCIGQQCIYTAGPTGPWMKNLGRTAVCQNEDKCTIKTSI
jgi:hypothetical protein